MRLLETKINQEKQNLQTFATKKLKDLKNNSSALSPVSTMATRKKIPVLASAIEDGLYRKRITQQELAKAILELREANPDKYLGATGLSYDVLSRLKTGTKPTLNQPTIQLLADALGIAVEEITAPNQENSGSEIENKQTPAKIILTSPEVTPIDRLIERTYVDLPFVGVPARASFLEMCGPASTYPAAETRRIYLSENNPPMFDLNKAFVFAVNGDSMEPYLESGDEVVAYLVDRAKWESIRNCVVVIPYSDGGDGVVTIKKIIQNDLFDKHELVLRPWRDELASFTVRLRDIQCIYVADERLSRSKIRL